MEEIIKNNVDTDKVYISYINTELLTTIIENNYFYGDNNGKLEFRSRIPSEIGLSNNYIIENINSDNMVIYIANADIIDGYLKTTAQLVDGKIYFHVISNYAIKLDNMSNFYSFY